MSSDDKLYEMMKTGEILWLLPIAAFGFGLFLFFNEGGLQWTIAFLRERGWLPLRNPPSSSYAETTGGDRVSPAVVLPPLPSVSHAAPSDDPPPSVPVTAPLDDPLSRLPRLVPYRQTPHTNRATAIPLGLAVNGFQWLDLGKEALHIGLYAQSGAGKDTLLRCWFLSLAQHNDPGQVLFAMIDGKGDWLTPNLAHLAHMFLPPAGGYGKQGDLRILEAVQAIDAEAQRRQECITRAGCRTREQYVQQTGAPMPLLVVVATDVMTSVAGKVEELLVNLVSKARSLGIRVIISMQTPTGRDTRWRMNLSTVVADALQSGSQDSPALGVETREMRYRPSQLPNPQERPGVFVVRVGMQQFLVQAPYISDKEFDRAVTRLPAVGAGTAVMAASGDGTGGDGRTERSVFSERPNAAFGLSDAANGGRSGSSERSDSGETMGQGGAADPNANVVMTPGELAQVAQAIRAFHDGATREQAITTAFHCRKGSSKAYQRASLLFDVAMGKGNS